MAGKAEIRERTAGATWQRAAERRERRGRAVAGAGMTGLSVKATRTCPAKGSTMRRWAGKKSIPRIGLERAARMKVQRKVRRPKDNVFLTVPQEAMDLPSAPVRGVPEEGAADRCGKTETAAPVSMRKRCSETESWR